MIELNYTLLWQMVNFLLLVLILNFIFFRPLRKVLEDRNKTFKGMESDISALNGEAQRRIEEWYAGLDAARKVGLEKRESVKKEGLEEEKRLLQQINAEVEKKTNEIRAQIAKDTAEARDALRAQIETFSREVAEKILGRSIS
ncbi:MAG TPA: hypothetical protein EYP21_03615 [Syntrophaceae bacterium]|nr:hypothetical protein [Syntrophaceae bacterium]